MESWVETVRCSTKQTQLAFVYCKNRAADPVTLGNLIRLKIESECVDMNMYILDLIDAPALSNLIVVHKYEPSNLSVCAKHPAAVVWQLRAYP